MLEQVARHTLLAYPVAVALGLFSAWGPCTPARMGWIATTNVHRPWRTIGVYVFGSVLAYALLGTLGRDLFDALFHFSTTLYLVMGLTALVSGLVVLWNPHQHGDEHDEPRSTAPGAIFLSGFASGLTFMPCCAPFVIAAIAWSTATWQAASLLVLYALGHTIPLWASPLLSRYLLNPRLASVAATLTGGVAVVIGAYFVVLA
jgi:cytochrome c biogenesis protein CcdA